MKQPGMNSFCLGGQPMHNVTLSYLRDFFSIYKKLPKFALAMLSELSSWNPNALGYADNDVLDFLRWMKIEGHLERTVIVLFSDRGSKHPNLRGLLEGKMEERMPLLAITIPVKAPKAIANSVVNLKANSKLLTHPYEVYETLKSMILYHVKREVEISKREPRNLLTRFDSESRSCDHLKIPAHWCPCVKAYPLPTHNANTSTGFEDAGKKVVSYVNKIISSNSELQSICSELSYRGVKIDKTVELKPNQEVLKFRGSESAGHCVDCKPIFEKHSTTRKESFYVIYIEVNPAAQLLRAIVNIGRNDIFIHPNLIFVNERKTKKCISNNSKLSNSPLERLCVCR